MSRHEHSPALSDFYPYTFPFLAFVGLTYLAPILDVPAPLAYPLKTISALILLFFFWPTLKRKIKPFWDVNAIMAGIAAYILWIGLEGEYPLIGMPSGFDPQVSGRIQWGWSLMIVRLLGASLVVPVIEEVFWRAFALRFLIRNDFTKVPLGTFSWFSFIMVSVAFGLEHHRWLPGILTGALYAMVLYQKKNLFSPILAHAVTNLLLGIYVVVNRAWQFW